MHRVSTETVSDRQPIVSFARIRSPATPVDPVLTAGQDSSWWLRSSSCSGKIAGQDSAQLLLAEDDHVVQAVAPD
jgi:hypothetical protein